MNLIGKSRLIILVAGDVVILYISLWLTLSLRYLAPVGQILWSEHWLPFSLVFVLWLGIFYINKLYDLPALKNNVNFYNNLLNSLIWCALIGFVFFYVTTTGISPKTVMVLEIFVFAALFIFWRRIFNRIASSDKLSENVLLVGEAREAGEVMVEIMSNPQLGQRLAGIVELNAESEANDEQNQIVIFPGEANLLELVKRYNINSVVLTEKAKACPRVMNQLYHSLGMKINILDLPAFAERYTNRIMVNTIGQAWFLENIKEGNKLLFEIVKRGFDILIGGALLICAVPFMPIIYILVKLDSKGSGFFTQQRTGKQGKKFMAVKFRTMYQNAETNGPQWARPDDPRVTRMGRFMRKTRIDEIPQLVNVIRGEMSFVGPRPERPEFVEKLKVSIPFYESRLLVKPGITGWAQINFPYGASEEDALQKLQYDLYYIKNRSLALDLSILLKTIKTVMSGGGR